MPIGKISFETKIYLQRCPHCLEPPLKLIVIKINISIFINFRVDCKHCIMYESLIMIVSILFLATLCVSAASVSQSFEIQVTVFPIDEDGSGGSGASNHTHKRTLVCGDGIWCDPIVIMHLGYLQYSRFRITVVFVGLESSSNKVVDVKFDVSSVVYNNIFIFTCLLCIS